MSLVAYSQGSALKKFTTIDSLTEITLLRNNHVYFVKYRSFSPLTVARDDKNRGGFSKHVGYIILEQGFGMYDLNSKGLKLKFEHSTKTVDSVSVQTLPTDPKTKTIKVQIRPFLFYARIHAPTFIDWQIVGKNGNQYNNWDGNDIAIEIPIKDLPQTIIVKPLRGEFPIQISSSQNQVIDLYINEYNLFHHPKISDKQYLIEDLIEIKNVL